MRMLYKYPQAAFPYARLVEENGRRGSDDPEFELLDTGVFDGDRYFDVEITYAKAAPDDILMEIVATNRGPDPARCRYCRSSGRATSGRGNPASRNRCCGAPRRARSSRPASAPARHAPRFATAARTVVLRERNQHAAAVGQQRRSPGYFKDGINDFVVGGDRAAVNPAAFGTKAAARYNLSLPGGGVGPCARAAEP